MISKEHLDYLKKEKKKKLIVFMMQILIFLVFLLIWQLLANFNLINTFITSSPNGIWTTIINLHNTNNLYQHIFITVLETFISFLIGTIIGIIIATILWWNKTLAKIFDPYLTILNSLPKIALGPILIIWIGANTYSIITMALLISVIITIINITEGFNNVDENKIKLMKAFKATKPQLFLKLIFPSNLSTIISTLKINSSMSLIGVIMGEFLVSKEGIGYLIMYGSQVFNLNLVMTGIFILCFVSALMYYLILGIEKKFNKRK